MTILEVNNLTKRFDSAEVLKDVSFTLERGKTLSIIGSSGSGKTTLLRCLNFLETADAGTISVGGETIFNASLPPQTDAELRQKRLHFGLVFQSFNLFPQYTAKRNITLAMELHAKEKSGFRENKKAVIKQISDRADALLTEVGLSDRADFYPFQLSGGQQQRVAIARALALDPEILCFDEPTSALDPELSGEVLSTIRRLAELGRTMILVTHEMSFARAVSDEVLFMAGGMISERGKPEALFANPQTERLRAFLSSEQA